MTATDPKLEADLERLRKAHPAAWSKGVLARIAELGPLLGQGRANTTLLDPYAGVHIDRLRAALPDLAVVGLELEPEWAACQPNVVWGDACALPWPDDSFDGVVTSICYGNRMADKHDNRDPCKQCEGTGCTAPGCLAGHPDDGFDHRICKNCRGSGLSDRRTYKHRLGRPLSDGSSAGLQWGTAYRAHHVDSFAEMRRVVRPSTPASGDRPAVHRYVVINIANHIRDGHEQPVKEWVIETWSRAGWYIDQVLPCTTPKARKGANHDLRADGEVVCVFRAPYQTTNQKELPL
jgi:hypothetical protein